MTRSFAICSGYGGTLRGRSPFAALLGAAVCLLFSGCAALTNPVADGLPVRLVPPELLTRPKDDARTIPLDLLGQPPAGVYRLAPDDVLGVWVDGVLGDNKVPLQVNVSSLIQVREQRRLPPTFGYPVAVREDGFIHLPLLDAMKVQGLSVAEAEDVIRNAYIKKLILPAAGARVIVTLMHQRQTHVVVMRQESGNITLGPSGGLAGGKRGTGHIVDLPAQENDVLHALAQTGGLPGLDAYNEIIIFHHSFRTVQDRAILLEKLRALPPGTNPAHAIGSCAHVVRIPLRQRPGEELPFGPEDVLLQTGDVVFIEARDQELFYTGGLLPANEHVLPRDVDLDVIKAIARVQGALVNGAFNTNNLAGNLIATGLGSPSPVLLTVLRRTPDGGQVPIRVDLDRALRDPRERILVHAGDVLILQEKPYDAISRYMTQSFFNFNLAYKAVHSNLATGVISVAAPDRIPGTAITVAAP